MKSIVQHLFKGKTDIRKVTISSRRPVITLVKNGLYVGRTPGRFLTIIGHRTGEALSIQEELELLGANEAARKIFPLAATPGSHWIYFGLFSTCRQAPGVAVLKKYLSFLDDKLNLTLAGVGRRLINAQSSKRKLQRQIERSWSVHNIPERIPEGDDMGDIIDLQTLGSLDNLVQSGRWDEGNYKRIAKLVRSAWCRQSPILRRNNHSQQVRTEAPRRIRDDALLRVYAGYWVIRSLYGIDIRHGDDYEDQGIVMRRDARTIISAANNALYYLKKLFRHVPEMKEGLGDLIEHIKNAKRSGEAPLIREYYRRQAEGRRVLSGFRLTRFWDVLYQLDEAVRRGFA